MQRELKEYIGSKVDLICNKKGLDAVKIAQPVLVKKLGESFNISGGKDPKMPTLADQVLVRGDVSGMIGTVEMTTF